MKKLAPVFVIFLLKTSVLSAQIDTTPPVLQCSAQSIYNIVGGLHTFWAEDFIDTLYDDQTASENIETGIRKVCTGEGFPEQFSNVFVAWEQEVYLEIWARDEAGNTATCYVDFVANYFGDFAMMQFQALGPPANAVPPHYLENVVFHVSGYNCLSDTISFDVDGNNTWFSPQNLHAGYTLEVLPTKEDNPLNGVTTYDLILIAKHILGIELLDSPYKILAADASQDGKVTMLDIILLRQLILGYINELPSGQSWRFVPENYVFPDPADPFLEPVPDRIKVPNTEDPLLDAGPYHFLGIKIGDVNFSAIINE